MVLMARICLWIFIGVSSLAGRITEPDFAKFGGKMAYGSQKKSFDFGSNPDHVRLGLGLLLGGAE